jgi:hypothetical protein
MSSLTVMTLWPADPWEPEDQGIAVMPAVKRRVATAEIFMMTLGVQLRIAGWEYEGVIRKMEMFGKAK